MNDSLSVALQSLLLINPLRLELLLSQFVFQVSDVLTRGIDLVVLRIYLIPQLLNLLIKSLLIRYFAILEVFDNVQLVLFQHIVVSVEFFVFFLEALGLGFCLLSESIVDFKLLRHLLVLFLLDNARVLQVLELVRLLVDLVLHVAHVQRGLRLLLIKAHLCITE